MNTTTEDNVNRSRTQRSRGSASACACPPGGSRGTSAGGRSRRGRVGRTEAGAPAVPQGPGRPSAPVAGPSGRVTRLRPRPAAVAIDEQLPLAVGFGSVLDATPRMLWVVPGGPAEVVALPDLLDRHLLDRHLLDRHLLDETGVNEEVVAPLRLARPRVDRQPAPLRLTARGRVALLVLAGLIGVGVVVMAWFGAASGPANPRVAPPARVVVHNGDTLWSIAGRVAPGRDPRAVVDQLRRLNHLASPNLVPGQVLRTH